MFRHITSYTCFKNKIIHINLKIHKIQPDVPERKIYKDAKMHQTVTCLIAVKAL